ITVKMISEHLHLSDRAVYVLFDLPPDKGGIRNFRVSAGGGGRRAMKKDYDLWLKKRRLCGGNEISE
uniref:hypothetical protein n=1 Tax=Anaerospora hongkongensis TaxID=244830 RepID=UPI002FDB2BE8